MTSALSELQIATIDAIVSVFESEGPGDYGAIARDPRDAGGLSYGKHQAALTKGTLHDLVAAYCAEDGAACAPDLVPYLPRMKAGDRSLDADRALYDLLKRASGDPVMQRVQDAFFGARYMGPALTLFSSLGFRHALSAAVIYDSFIHSGGLNMRTRTEARFGPPGAETEEAWIAGYVSVRKEWLSTHANPLLRATAVRMATFERLISAGNWDLSLPLDVVRPAKAYPLTPFDFGDHLFPGNPFRRLSPDKFGVAAPKAASGPNGRDRFIQTSLARLGYLKGAVDGVYGQGTALAVKSFQKSIGLPQSGAVDGSIFARMCDCLEEMAATPDPEASRAGDGLKRLPPEQATPTSNASAVGAAAAGGAAGVGAIALGSGDLSEPTVATSGPVTEPDKTPVAGEAGASGVTDGTPLAQDAPSPASPEVVQADQTGRVAPGPSQTGDSAVGAVSGSGSQEGAVSDQPVLDVGGQTSSPAPASVPEAVAVPAAERTSPATVQGVSADRVEAFGFSATQGEVMAFGVGALFVAAVALFAYARRTLATGRR